MKNNNSISGVGEKDFKGDVETLGASLRVEIRHRLLTEVFVADKDGHEEVYGYAIHNPKDQYSSSKGEEIALGRALKEGGVDSEARRHVIPEILRQVKEEREYPGVIQQEQKDNDYYDDYYDKKWWSEEVPQLPVPAPEGFEYTGEKRLVLPGEYYLTSKERQFPGPLQLCQHFIGGQATSVPYWILRKKTPQAPVKFGFYSAKADLAFGTVIYRTKDGKEVEVTAVDEDQNAPSYQWSDKIYVGEVKEYLRRGKGRFVEFPSLAPPEPVVKVEAVPPASVTSGARRFVVGDVVKILISDYFQSHHSGTIGKIVETGPEYNRWLNILTEEIPVPRCFRAEELELVTPRPFQTGDVVHSLTFNKATSGPFVYKVGIVEALKKGNSNQLYVVVRLTNPRINSKTPDDVVHFVPEELELIKAFGDYS